VFVVGAPAIGVYADGPAGQSRQYVTTPGAVNAGALSDAASMAAPIIASPRSPRPPSGSLSGATPPP
jgi:hypothetical protein